MRPFVYKISFDPTQPGLGYNTTTTKAGKKVRTHPAKGQWYVFKRYPDRGESNHLFHASTFDECLQWINEQKRTPST